MHEQNVFRTLFGRLEVCCQLKMDSNSHKNHERRNWTEVSGKFRLHSSPLSNTIETVQNVPGSIQRQKYR